MLFEEQKTTKKKRKENINLKVLKGRNGRTMLSSNVMYVKAKKKKIIKCLDLKTPSSKIPLFGDILFEFY